MTDYDTVKENGLLLHLVDNQTPELCMAAVQEDGLVLQFVEEQTYDICMAAVLENGQALKFVKEQTPDLCMAAFQQIKNANKYYYLESAAPEDNLCPICQDDESTDNEWCEINKCKHKFHISCIEQWLQVQKTCPKCRSCLI